VALTPVSTTKPTVNVYIENSGSMAGYMSGYSGFKDAVGNYLTDISSSNVAKDLNLFFINKSAQLVGYDVNTYLTKLTTSCNAATSDIAQIFQNVLSQTDNNAVSVFITDGIFSPEKGKDAAQYLKQQQMNIKSAVAKYLDSFPATAIVVYQLSSKFDGYYYNSNNTKKKISEPRPYYIWVIGNIQHITLLKLGIPESSFKGSGIQHSFTQIPSLQQEIPDYAILNSPKFGSFERNKKSPKTSIYNIERAKSGEHKGDFMITVGMDVSLFKLLLGEEFLLNTNSYNRLIEKATNDTIWFGEMNIFPNTTSGTKHTHNLQMLFKQDTKIPSDTLIVALINRMPQWVSDVNDDDGLTPVTDKTFGIKYLVEGVYEAYRMRGNVYATMKFNLKK
jgi:hypothetical protein